MTPAFSRKLRPYQAKAAEEILAHLKAGARPLLVAPTGSGKTIIAAEVAKSFNHVLVIAHRREIIEQARNTFGWQVTALTVQGILAGGELSDLLPHEVDLLIIDEAHRAVAQSYRKIREMFPNASVLGMTATALRADGKGLCDAFSVIVECSSMTELRDLGFLVPYRAFEAPDEALNRLASLKKIAGDYATRELSGLMNTPRLVGDVVREWKKNGMSRKTICFAVSVKHSTKLAQAFKKAGIRAAHLDGRASDGLRSESLEALRSGKIDVLCNVNLFTEGWDCPTVSCVIMARPTQSLTLYLQSVGRGMRPDGSKDDLLILDHAGNIERHGMPDEPRVWSLEGEREKDKRQAEERETARLFALGFDSIEAELEEKRRIESGTYATPACLELLDLSPSRLAPVMRRFGIKGIGNNAGRRYPKAEIDKLKLDLGLLSSTEIKRYTYASSDPSLKAIASSPNKIKEKLQLHGLKPVTRINDRRPRFLKSEVDAWLAERNELQSISCVATAVPELAVHTKQPESFLNRYGVPPVGRLGKCSLFVKKDILNLVRLLDGSWPASQVAPFLGIANNTAPKFLRKHGIVPSVGTGPSTRYAIKEIEDLKARLSGLLEESYSASECCKLLGLHKGQLSVWLRRRGVERIGNGARSRYSKADIDAIPKNSPALIKHSEEISRLRNSGLSWEKIANAVGCSAMTAWESYKRITTGR